MDFDESNNNEMDEEITEETHENLLSQDERNAYFEQFQKWLKNIQGDVLNI